MKRWLVVSLLLAACGGICPDDKQVTRDLASGTFVLAQESPDCKATLTQAASDSEQHELEISADHKQVTETFTRAGHTFKVVYDVTNSEKL